MSVRVVLRRRVGAALMLDTASGTSLAVRRLRVVTIDPAKCYSTIKQSIKKHLYGKSVPKPLEFAWNAVTLLSLSLSLSLSLTDGEVISSCRVFCGACDARNHVCTEFLRIDYTGLRPDFGAYMMGIHLNPYTIYA